MATADEWWRVIRRALGIPDIVSGNSRGLGELANDERAVAWKLLGPPNTDAAVRARPRAERGAVLLARTLAKQGENGILDQYLVPFGHNKAEHVPSLLRGWSGVDIQEQMGTAEVLWQKVTAYIGAHPFDEPGSTAS